MRLLSGSPTTAVDASSAAPLLVAPAAAAATVGGVLQPPAGGSDASFDAEMVIILAMMLCILVCAIGLNSLISSLRLHCGDRTLITMAAPHAAAAMAVVPATDGGLKKKELRRIPVVVYEAKAGVSASEECAICLGEFGDGEKVRVLPRCYHGFHVECIDVWLATHSSCPTCRNSLLEDEGGAVAGEATPTVAGEAGT